MNLLRPITIESAGNERNNIIKPKNEKFLKIRGENSFRLRMSDF